MASVGSVACDIGAPSSPLGLVGCPGRSAHHVDWVQLDRWVGITVPHLLVGLLVDRNALFDGGITSLSVALGLIGLVDEWFLSGRLALSIGSSWIGGLGSKRCPMHWDFWLTVTRCVIPFSVDRRFGIGLPSGFCLAELRYKWQASIGDLASVCLVASASLNCALPPLVCFLSTGTCPRTRGAAPTQHAPRMASWISTTAASSES